MNWKNRLTNYNFWVSIVSAVILILQALKIEFDIAYINEIVTAILGLLVVIGIINDPTKSYTKLSQTKNTTENQNGQSQILQTENLQKNLEDAKNSTQNDNFFAKNAQNNDVLLKNTQNLEELNKNIQTLENDNLNSVDVNILKEETKNENLVSQNLENVNDNLVLINEVGVEEIQNEKETNDSVSNNILTEKIIPTNEENENSSNDIQNNIPPIEIESSIAIENENFQPLNSTNLDETNFQNEEMQQSSIHKIVN